MERGDLVPALLERCQAAGLAVHLAGDRLRLERREGPPPAELLEELRAERLAIICHLTAARRALAPPCTTCGRFAFPRPGVRCYWCRSSGRKPVAVPALSTPLPAPGCRSCGGGLHRTASAGGPCWSCRRVGVGAVLAGALTINR